MDKDGMMLLLFLLLADKKASGDQLRMLLVLKASSWLGLQNFHARRLVSRHSEAYHGIILASLPSVLLATD